MDAKEKEIKSRKSKLLTAFVMLLSLIFTLIAVTFAWYTMTNDSSLNEVTIRVSSDLNIQVSVTGGYSGEAQAFVGNTRLKPMVGNGLDFFVPESFDIFGKKVGELNGVSMYAPTPESLRQITTEEREKNIYKIDFSIFATKKAKLYLGNGCEVLNYSDNIADNISAATRIAFVKEPLDGQYELKCIWIPNSRTQLTVKDGKFVVNGKGAVESAYSFYDSPTSHFELSTLNGDGVAMENGSAVINGITYLWGTPIIGKFFDQVEIGITRYHMYLWVDGTDRECLPALMQGYSIKEDKTEGGRVIVKLSIEGESVDDYED